MEIIYIMGRGHNGSTVLDLILGNHPDICGVGELTAGMERGNKEHCTCGKSLDECVFWSPIRETIDRNFPDIKCVQYEKMLPYVDKFYRMPQILTRCFLPRWVKTEFQPMSRCLFESISKESNKKFILDSSKNYGRAAFLLSRYPKEVKVIHLVRDGRAIMWSYLKRFRKTGTLKFFHKIYKPRRTWPIMAITVLALVVGELLTLPLRMLYGKQMLTIRYEDICENPKNELTRIGEFIGVDLNELGEKVEKGQPLKIGHNIGGNAMRRSDSGDFTFKPDYIWKEKLPQAYGRLYKILGFIHAWTYKYK